jgi:hypothetical protein
MGAREYRRHSSRAYAVLVNVYEVSCRQLESSEAKFRRKILDVMNFSFMNEIFSPFQCRENHSP